MLPIPGYPHYLCGTVKNKNVGLQWGPGKSFFPSNLANMTDPITAILTLP